MSNDVLKGGNPSRVEGNVSWLLTRSLESSCLFKITILPTESS